jgi:cobalt/nickel transport system permease protein
MHISEGVLSGPMLGAGAAVAAAGVALGLRKMENRSVPEVAVISSALFVAALVRFPVGPASVHLTLNGLAGVMLGWMAFPAIFVALVFHALFFQYGGFTTLGANTAVMAIPALAAYYICRPLLNAGSRKAVGAAGALAGAIGTTGGGALIAFFLMFTEGSFKNVVFAISASLVPVIAVEAAVTAFILLFILKVKPELLEPEKRNGRG